MGFVVEREQEKLYGWVILFNGPLGILGGIYAWYANVLFAFVVLRLLCTKVTASNKGIVASAFLAVLVSLDSFRFDLHQNEFAAGKIGNRLWSSFELQNPPPYFERLGCCRNFALGRLAAACGIRRRARTRKVIRMGDTF